MPMATSSSLAAATATAATASSSSASTLSGGGGSSGVGGSVPLIGTSAAQFREIHKNTWLKRLTAEGKKITVGPKKSDRSWVVFCVHDDTDALLEGYAEPRQAASHIPEWTISMQDTLHISHALIPNSHEFEFVVTLTNEVIRFHAMSWEIMQEWVETLRSKLREMKILSPRENLYTKLPEIRAPLLPTRDPTSPLPAPPPVPAAIVPGVERVVPPSLAVLQDNSVQETATRLERNTSTNVATSTTISTITQSTVTTASTFTGTVTTTTSTPTSQSANSSTVENANITTTAANRGNAAAVSNTIVSLPALTSMSNTLTQNLLNMLSDPISAYSEQINDVSYMDETSNSVGDANDILDFDDEFLSPILRRSLHEQDNTKSKTNADNSVRFDVGQRASADQVKNWENFAEAEYSSTFTRPQTSRSLSAGAADSSRKSITKSSIPNNYSTNKSNDNITALEISTDAQSQLWQNVQSGQSTIFGDTATTTEQLDVDKMNITIIEVSTNDSNEQEQNEAKRTKSTSKASPSSSSRRVTGDIFKFPETTVQHEYKSNVQIIPSTKTNSSTIQVLGNKINNTISTATTTTNKTRSTTTMTATQYATPVKKNIPNVASSSSSSTTTKTTATAATKITTTGTLLSNTDELQITTVHVTGNSNTTATATNSASTTATTTATTNVNNVVANSVSLYGTCYSTTPSQLNSNILQSTNANSNVNGTNDVNGGGGGGGTPKMTKKIILSANSSGITNITVNNSNTSAACDTTTIKHNVGSVHYEKVFLSTSVPPAPNVDIINALINIARPISPTLLGGSSPTPKRRTEITTTLSNKSIAASTSKPSSPIPQIDSQKQSKQPTVAARSVSPLTGTVNDDMPSLPPKSRHKVMQSPLMSRAHRPNASPVPDRRRLTTATTPATSTINQAITQAGTSSPPPSAPTSSSTKTAATTAAFSSTPFPPLPANRAHLLTRGLTEAVITTRPSRRDLHVVKGNASRNKSSTEASKNSTAPVTSNNNGNNMLPATNAGNSSSSSAAYHPPQSSSRNRNCDLLEQRRRSSSTSDARPGATRGANNNELPGGRNVALRFQQPPQSFRNMENGSSNGGGGGGGVSGSGTALSTSMPPPSGGSANVRMTLREHQVMQLRREIMHPGGVRLQLRRKDCVGSIAWVDTFGAVWVAGWKQKEHPVLYNALHIGDQLLSIAGTAVATASEANKIIRNTNTLFVEVLVRRIPFGRGYAIRREREGQCLGLIRDGNTATIVDVVPNSLAARHGLPPKAQSCDGTTLTFWVLTEINGRPLNLYFKDNEIRDRLNSVGRDISILVQPSDLITKLKKQLKSLRGYKDYLVQ